MKANMPNGFVVEFSMGPGGLSDFKCEWEPRQPRWDEFTEPFRVQYESARNSFLSDEAEKRGMEMVVGPHPGVIGFKDKTK